ncbi:CHAD domain-containing protein [Streptomyces sp. HSG2]|uniref:CHAD domain-containing protein n=1 Tax=Streptomyces sp. HSG2 TaxID=2797167 RepID=UPI001904CE98|nr:CHAD domain-containing protein [Streptomyces sp. HSG2]
MAKQHHEDEADASAGPVPVDALVDYLRAQATEFLRALRRHREASPGTPGGGRSDAGVGPALDLRRAARRISGSLHTFQPLLDQDWAERLRPELAWVSGTLAAEHAHARQSDRLLQALHRLSDAPPPSPVGGPPTPGSPRPPAPRAADRPASGATTPTLGPIAGAGSTVIATRAPGRTGADRGSQAVGAAKAGALLERRLTTARNRAHSTTLRALGSARFHALADQVAVLAGEVPLAGDRAPAAGPAGRRLAPGRPGAGPTRSGGHRTSPAGPTDLRPRAAAAEGRLGDAVAALPLVTAGRPYNATALAHGLSPNPAPHSQDAPWHQVRLLLRLHRYALEVLHGEAALDDARLAAAGRALDRHRDAAEAAAAAAQAARTPRIAPATAYALGVLHADQRHEVEAARYAFHDCWRHETVGSG